MYRGRKCFSLSENLPAALFSLPYFFTGTVTAFLLVSYGMMRLYEDKKIYQGGGVNRGIQIRRSAQI